MAGLHLEDGETTKQRSKKKRRASKRKRNRGDGQGEKQGKHNRGFFGRKFEKEKTGGRLRKGMKQATEKLEKSWTRRKTEEGASDGSCGKNEEARVRATAAGKAGEEERNRHGPLAPEFPISIRESLSNKSTVSLFSKSFSVLVLPLKWVFRGFIWGQFSR